MNSENVPLVGVVYRHFKGKHYRVMAVGVHTETGEEMVIYIPVGGGQVYVRPYTMWMEIVDGKPRFERIPSE